MLGLVEVRSADASDGPRLWALNSLPNVGATGDPALPPHLPLPTGPPRAFPDLADVHTSFVRPGGAFLVVELEDPLSAWEASDRIPLNKPRCCVCVFILRPGVGGSVGH